MNHELPIFCYGTLRPGWSNSRIWMGRADVAHDGACYAIGVALHDAGPFPYARSSTNSVTAGALIMPHPGLYGDILERLDMLEGVPNHYHRTTVAVHTPYGIECAWIYLAASDVSRLPEVPSNDWTQAHMEPVT